MLLLVMGLSSKIRNGKGAVTGSGSSFISEIPVVRTQLFSTLYDDLVERDLPHNFRAGLVLAGSVHRAVLGICRQAGARRIKRRWEREKTAEGLCGVEEEKK